MPRPLTQEVFDATKPVIARKKFIANGRHYKPGDEFDWRRQAVDQRRVVQMFTMGMLRHKGLNEELIDAPKAPLKSKSSPPPSSSVSADIPPASGGEDAPTDSDELDGIDNMIELREIAKAEGAPLKVSKVDQRQAIRDHRAASA
jgi:hypothetical protein